MTTQAASKSDKHSIARVGLDFAIIPKAFLHGSKTTYSAIGTKAAIINLRHLTGVAAYQENNLESMCVSLIEAVCQASRLPKSLARNLAESYNLQWVTFSNAGYTDQCRLLNPLASWAIRVQ